MVRLIIMPLIVLATAAEFQYPGDRPLTNTSHATYPEHLTGAFTGGFGEETCRSCHFDYDLNPDGGSLKISGFPENPEGGKVVGFKIKVERVDLGRAGFQMSARFTNGSQAGTFLIGNNNQLVFTGDVGGDSLQYVQHSTTGSKVDGKDSKTWMVKWRVPDNELRPIIINVAANAANGDQSEFGDYIYSKEIVIE